NRLPADGCHGRAPAFRRRNCHRGRMIRRPGVIEPTRMQVDIVANDVSLGVLEVLGNGSGFIRRREASYLPGQNDIYVAQKLIQKHGLRTGDELSGEVGRLPGKGDRKSVVEENDVELGV